jgi:hypothetical protein
VERKKKLKKVEDIYHEMELVIRKEMKYVLLKMSMFYNKYLWALMKSLVENGPFSIGAYN